MAGRKPRLPNTVMRAGAASQRLTQQVLAFYGTRCWLELPGCTGLATTKDHVIPVDHGGTDAIENLRPACSPCNSKRRNLAISGIGGINVTVLLGPHPEDLSDRAAAAAAPEDLIIDLARIRTALTTTGQPSHHLERVAGRAFKSAMDQALRIGARCSVWLVHPLPTAKQLQQYARLRYTIETHAPTRALSEQIAAASGDSGRMREVARWWAQYPEGVASVERVKAHRPHTGLTDTTTESAGPSRSW